MEGGEVVDATEDVVPPQNDTVEEHTTEPEPTQTVSQSKVEGIPLPSDELTDVPPSGYRFMDLGILENVFSILICPKCFVGKVKMVENKNQGLSFQLKLDCSSEICNWSNEFWTSKKQSRHYDVNRRTCYAMRRVGSGYSGKFLMLMNHPPPMTEKHYRKINYMFRDAAKEVGETIMKEASDEIRKENHCESDQDDIVDTGVSIDGTWQRRGFSSLNCAVAAISVATGRILDVEAMSRFCQGCVNIEKFKENITLYESLKAEHNCSINHVGSAGQMEVIGAEHIFSRSIEMRKLRYTEYYGDGDSKGFNTIENIYAPKVVYKKECIGHVQKRVGSRLKKLKKQNKRYDEIGCYRKSCRPPSELLWHCDSFKY